MKKLVSKPLIGALALLASSAGMAASVTVVPSATNVAVGGSFTVVVHGDAFPEVAGATLGLTFNSNVSVTAIGLAPGSPFTGGTTPTCNPSPGPACSFSSGSLISVIGPLVGQLPSGSFDAYQVTFLANAEGPAGITIVDDQSDFCWSDSQTFACVPDVQYTQANVTVGVVPVPAAAWLLLSGLGSIVGIKRLRRA